MHYSSTIFNQLLNFLPKTQFDQFVGQHEGDKWVKKMDTWNELVILLYSQASGKDSLREIEVGLDINTAKWYHLGIQSAARSTISYALNNRDYQIYEKLFYALLEKTKAITPTNRFNFENPLYSIDSTTVQLCLSIFDWAHFRTAKGAFKIHTLLNNRTAIPEFLTVTDGKSADISVIKSNSLALEKGSIAVFDRGYLDFSWWDSLNSKGLFFVSRSKTNVNLFFLGQHQSPVGKGILADDLVLPCPDSPPFKYTSQLRRVRFFDSKTQKEYVFLTNNFTLPAVEIAAIYKSRWQIETFFKWIKQNLKIKSFLGTSKNAVLSQVWAAMIYYLLLAYIKFQTKFKRPLLELTWMIRETLLQRQPLIDLLSLRFKNIFKIRQFSAPQLQFF